MMTTTATPTPTTQAVAEWTKIFPKQVTENYTSSVTFVKQLTVVAISTITYLKNVFPEDSYMVENFGGLKLRILKKTCTNELAQFLTTALTQAFEAFDKRYLHQLALCFYEDECKVENMIEYHIFEYSYNSEGVTLNIHSKNRNNVKSVQKCSFDNVRERTIHMIRACVVTMQMCNYELPSTYDVSIRLYYNDDAPEGYQAPGFLSTQETEDHLEPTLNDVLKLGWVETPYHKVVSKCYVKDNLKASHEAIASQNPPLMSQMDTDDFTDAESRAGEVRCPCNKIDLDDDTPMLTCWYCQSKQHACCFGIHDVSQVRRHCCELCALREPARVPTDATLHTLTIKKRECLCIFRRALILCTLAPSITTRDVIDKFSISEVNATKLIKLLHSHGIVLEDGADLNAPRKIVPEHLKAVMTKFFHNCEEETIVNRLLAETFASQESLSDPVSEVLSPMEKVSLQNETNLGRIIENNTKDLGSTEDSTLKRYREALIANDDHGDELPLSGSHNPVKDLEGIGKRTSKRKMSNEEDKPAMRTGVRTKRAKTMPKK